MTSIFQIDEHNDMWQMLPGGVYILARHHYTQPEVEGVFAVSIAAIVSVLAITMLLLAILISLIQNWRDPDSKRSSRHAFIKSHAGIYFISMLLSTFICTLGFMLSMIWAVDRTITFGTFCTVQAALKQFGNVATALWVLAIAVHTFVAVFMQKVVPNWVFWIVFVVVWLLSAAIIAAGPLMYVTEQMGPWYGISGQWCWTSDSYVMPRFTTEYFWIFLTAAVSFILYTLLFFKLRGNFGDGFRFTFKRRPVGPEPTRVANQMLWYPVVYFFLVCPIAGCRIYEIIAIKQANLAIKMASAVLFMLSGLANVVLYTLTRNIFRPSQLLPRPLRYFFARFFPSINSNSDSEKDGDIDGFQKVGDVSPAQPVFKGPTSNYGSGSETLSGGSSPIDSSKRGSSSLDSSNSHGYGYGPEKMVRNADSPINVVGSPIPSPPAAYQGNKSNLGVKGTPTLHKSSSLLSFQSSKSFMGSKTNIGLDKSGAMVIKKPLPAARRNSGGSNASSGSRPGSRQDAYSPELNPFSSGSPASSSLDNSSPIRGVLRDLEPTRSRSPTELKRDDSHRINLKKIPVRGQSKGAVERHDLEGM